MLANAVASRLITFVNRVKACYWGVTNNVRNMILSCGDWAEDRTIDEKINEIRRGLIYAYIGIIFLLFFDLIVLFTTFR